jgi:hypothetical protein
MNVAKSCCGCAWLGVQGETSRLACVEQVQVVDLTDRSQKATLLIGDIGGTNCRFELVDADLVSRERLQDGTFAQACSR